MTDWKDFVMLLVGVTLLFAGAAMFVAMIDHDHNFEYQGSSKSPPSDMTTNVWENLDERERGAVAAAIEGRRFTFEHKEEVPGEAKAPGVAIRRNGTYYSFGVWRSIDWLDPGTFRGLATMVAGLAMSLYAIRRDIRSRSPAAR